MVPQHQGIRGIYVLLIVIERKKTYDYIICGGGASGLLLAQKLATDSFFKDRKIALIEKGTKNQNDRTWCFWENSSGDFDHLLHTQWRDGYFGSAQFTSEFSLQPFSYKMLRSKPFYDACHQILENSPQIDRIQAEVFEIEEQKSVYRVRTATEILYGKRVFSSLFDPTLLEQQKKYPVLQQHFLGWFVTTEKAVFDPNRIHFMDFDIPQDGATRFIYVLPFSVTEALVEYTLFSAELLPLKEYESGIESYLESLDCGNFQIKETEQGSIPMTSYRFDRHNTNHLIHIGTAGGWTKASTGFTFKKTTEKIDALVAFLKTDKPFTQFWKPDRFWFYDLLFLDVLATHNAYGHELFRMMFQKNTPEVIFKFLDEKTSFWEEIRIMISFPISLFVKALWKRLF